MRPSKSDTDGRTSAAPAPRLLIFDFDGTIADSEKLIVRVYNGLADKYRFRRIGDADYESLLPLSLKERLKRLQVPLHRPLLLRRLAADLKAGYREGLAGVRAVPRMPELIRGLSREGYALAILSSNGADIIKDYLAAADMTAFEDVRSSGGLFGKHRALRRYLRERGAKPEEALYIGDETRDIEACRKAGVRVIAVAWGLETKARLAAAGPDYMADRPDDVAGLLAAIRREAGS